MFNTATPETEKSLAGLYPERLNSNQQTVPLPCGMGRDWFAPTWFNRKPYNITVVSSGGGGKSAKSGGGATTKYAFDIGGVVACGPFDYIEAIRVGGEVIWTVAGGIVRDADHPEHTGDIVVADKGVFRFHWGTDTASGDWLVLHNCGDEEHPYYRRQAVLECHLISTSTSVPNVEVLIERAPSYRSLDGNRSREGANPITWICEYLSNSFFGFGLEDVIDEEAAATLAEYFRSKTQAINVEGYDMTAQMGYLSVWVKDKESFGSHLATLLEHVDGWARRKGEKLEFGVFKHDAIDTAGLKELTLHDVVEKPQPPNYAYDHPSVYTDAIVTGKDRDWDMQDSWEPGSNHTARERLQTIRRKSYERRYCITSYQRKHLAQELADFYSVPAADETIKPRVEKAAGVQPGDRIIFSYSATNSRKVYRVTRRKDYATEGYCELTIIRERLLAPLTWKSITVETPTRPEPPAPVSVVLTRMFQVPPTWAGGPAPKLLPLVVRPSLNTLGYQVHYSREGNSYDQLDDSQNFALGGSLAEAVTPGATSITATITGFDLPLLVEQSDSAQADNTLLVIMGQEIGSAGAITALGAGKYTISLLRGRLGSSPASHDEGSRIYVLRRDACTLLDHAEFPRAAETRYFKLPTYTTSRDTQELADATRLAFVFADTPVNTPTDFTAAPATEAATLKWLNPKDPDLAYAEVHVVAKGAQAPDIDAVPAATWPVISGGATTYLHPGMIAGTPKDFFLRLVDSGGYKSEYVGPRSATPLSAPKGTDGVPGIRGSKWLYVPVNGAAWSDAAASAAYTDQGLVTILGDIVTEFNTLAGFSLTKIFSGTAWQTVAQVIDGGLIVKGTVAAESIAAGEVAALYLSGISALRHPNYPGKYYQPTDQAVSYSASKTWEAASNWGFTHLPAATFYGPGNTEGSTPRMCPNSTGALTVNFTARILSYTGLITFYYRRNGGAFIPLLAIISDDGGNAVAHDTQRIYGIQPTDKLEFFVAPCSGEGGISTAIANKWVNVEVTAFNW
jgi:hypothetical protein